MKILKFLIAAAALAFAGFTVIVVLAKPVSFDDAELPQHMPDVDNGKRLFTAGGCLSCHAPPPGSGIDAALPAGGTGLPAPVGTFYPPNITPDRETGIGAWNDAEFISAMAYGTSPDGRHYFPAFPYTSYRYMSVSDLLDVKAYLFSLTPVRNTVSDADVPLAPVGRLLMGPWKWLAFTERPVASDPAKGELWNRGAYLVQGAGHCAECHTPRNLLMISKGGASFLAGGPHPEGKGKVPSLRGLIARGKYKDASDLASALAYGETFGYDNISSGGMGKVQTNLGLLPEEDVQAIAAFLADLQ